MSVIVTLGERQRVGTTRPTMKSPDQFAPTPYPKLNAVLAALVGGLRRRLGATLMGVYLQGSFAVGDFDLYSDVDFIVVIAEELSVRQLTSLQRMHRRIFALESPWAQHLEGSYFPKDVLRQHQQLDQMLWYLDNGARSLIRADHCNTNVVRWVVREQGVTLTGPPPRTLVDAIPTEMLRTEIYAAINGWGREILAHPQHFCNRFYQGFIVLNYCRMLHDLHTGFPGSKTAGAGWAKANLDPRWAGLIDRAWSGRPNPAYSVRQPADPADFQRTLEFIKYIMGESEGYAPESM